MILATIRDGSVYDAMMVSGDPLLRQAALDAVKTWKYEAVSEDGVSIPVDTEISVNFSIGR